jgi:hypothetical protein
VQTGIGDLLRTQILSGLVDGDLVVVEGTDRLREGARITTSLRPADRLAPLPTTSQASQTSL